MSAILDTLRNVLQCFPLFPPGRERDYSTFSILLIRPSKPINPTPTGESLLSHVTPSTRSRLESAIEDDTHPEPRQLSSYKKGRATLSVPLFTQASPEPASVQLGHESFRVEDVIISDEREQYLDGVSNVDIEDCVRKEAVVPLLFKSTLRQHVREEDGESFVFGVVTETHTAKLSVRTEKGAKAGGRGGPVEGEVERGEGLSTIGEGVVGVRMVCFFCKVVGVEYKISTAIAVAFGDEKLLKKATMWVTGGPGRFLRCKLSRWGFGVMDVIDVANDQRLDEDTRAYLLRAMKNRMGEDEEGVEDCVLGLYAGDLWPTPFEGEKMVVLGLEACFDEEVVQGLEWMTAERPTGGDNARESSDEQQKNCTLC